MYYFVKKNFYISSGIGWEDQLPCLAAATIAVAAANT